jgi:hypothetical protein
MAQIHERAYTPEQQQQKLHAFNAIYNRIFNSNNRDQGLAVPLMVQELRTFQPKGEVITSPFGVNIQKTEGKATVYDIKYPVGDVIVKIGKEQIDLKDNKFSIVRDGRSVAINYLNADGDAEVRMIDEDDVSLSSRSGGWKSTIVNRDNNAGCGITTSIDRGLKQVYLMQSMSGAVILEETVPSNYYDGANSRTTLSLGKIEYTDGKPSQENIHIEHHETTYPTIYDLNEDLPLAS